MIRNLFVEDSKCRTIDVCDIFGDNSGKALYRLDGNANDESGNYHGTETAITYGGGVYERGAVFNGTSSYINPNFNAVPLSTTVTSVSMWFKYTGTPNLFLFGADNGATNYIFLATNSARYGTSPASDITFTPITGINHIVAVFRGAALGYSVYLNNVLVGNKVSTDYTGVGYNPVIGARNSVGGMSAFFNSMIDQVRIFNRAITATEVATLYAECAPTSTVSSNTDVLTNAIAHYKLDGNALDSNGSYNGTETAMTYADGRFGQAGVFNGTTSNIQLPQKTPMGAKSVSLWYKTTATTAQSFLSDGGPFNNASTANQGFGLNIVASGSIHGTIKLSAANSYLLDVSYVPANARDGNYHHLCFSWDGTTSVNAVNLYYDGVLVSSSTSSGLQLETPSANIMLGQQPISSPYYLNGNIDQVRIYNRALTQTEVTALYNESQPVSLITNTNPFNDTSCKALYRFENNVLDDTGTYNGTATNITYGTGKFGQGAVFNGTSSKVTTTSNGFWNMPLPRTLSCYVKGNPNGVEMLVSTIGSANGYIQENPTGSTNMQIFSSTNTVIGTATGILNNIWNHLVVVQNNIGTYTYVNGVLTSTGAVDGVVGTTGMYIGGYQGGTQWYNGSIDQLRIFNKALTQQEVQALLIEAKYQATTLPTVELDPFLDNSCKALYKFDNNVLDSYGQYDGTATGITYGTGKFGQCAVFNGSTGYISIPKQPTAKAFSFWANVALNTTDTKQLFSDSLSAASVANPSVYITSGPVSASISNETLTISWFDGTNYRASYITAVFDNSDMKHIVIQWNGTAYNIFVNGISQTVSTFSTVTYLLDKFDIIGKHLTAYYASNIDQLRIFNKALTPMEVASLYNETTPMEEPMHSLVDPFKDGSGKALYRLDGNALDESGNFNGTPTSVTYGAGRFGQAGVFNGTSSYTDIPYSLTLDKSNCAVSLWFKTSTSGFRTLFSLLKEMYLTANMNASGGINAGDGIATISTPLTYIDGNWHHIIVGKFAGILRVYIDGVLVISDTVTRACSTTAYYSSIGGYRSVGAWEQFFNGSIDQVRIFNRALTASEVQTLYTGENNPI